MFRLLTYCYFIKHSLQPLLSKILITLRLIENICTMPKDNEVSHEVDSFPPWFSSLMSKVIE